MTMPHLMNCGHSDAVEVCKTGMTLRDYFAAKALPALIQLFTTGDLTAKDGRPVTEKHIAEQAYCFADAMLAERAKGGAE